MRLLTKILFQLGIEIIVLVYVGKSLYIYINYWEEFVFMRRSTTEKFLFVVGGECYFNVGCAFFFFGIEHFFFFFSIGTWVDNW